MNEWDPWMRYWRKREYGLRDMESADPFYVIEKQTGLGTKPGDYFNLEYRFYMDLLKKRNKKDYFDL